MLTNASKGFSIRLIKQYKYILTNNDQLNRIKGGTKMKNILSLFNYQSRF